MGKPLHSKIRKVLINLFFRILSFCFGANNKKQDILSVDFKRILLIRLNYRIGNILFMTPLIKELEKNAPNAKIDVLVGAIYLAPLLTPMQNVNNVYDFPRNLLLNPIKLYRFFHLLNNNHYDLVISPVESSGSSRISTLLVKAKYKLGFTTEGVWNPNSLCVPTSNHVTHEALKPLALMKIFPTFQESKCNFLDISISEREKRYGLELLKNLTEKHGVKNSNSIVVGLFRGARYDKKLPDNWWKSYCKTLLSSNLNLIVIDVLSPDISDKLSDHVLPIFIRDLRELASFISNLTFFISADTGPMHLAAAARVPVIAVFDTTSPNKYAPLSKNSKVILKENKIASDIANESIQTILDVLNVERSEEEVKL